MAQVAQAYFHFTSGVQARQLRRFGRRMDDVARQAALQYFETTVLINVEIEEGSTIGRVTAYATALGLWTGLISDYKGVKESLAEMSNDARSFGSVVIEKAIEIAGISEKQVYRVERRTKTVGKLRRLLDDVDRLQHSVDELSPSQMKRELARLRGALEVVSGDLQPEEREVIVGALKHTNLPPPNKWPEPKPEQRRVMLRPEQLQLIQEEQRALERRREKVRKPLRYENSFKVSPRISGAAQEKRLLPPSEDKR